MASIRERYFFASASPCSSINLTKRFSVSLSGRFISLSKDERQRYAWHGIQRMGCKDPVRERTSSERQYTNCDLGKPSTRSTAARVTGRGEETRESARQADTPFRRRPHSHQNCGSRDGNLIPGRIGQASEPTLPSPPPPADHDRPSRSLGGRRRDGLVFGRRVGGRSAQYRGRTRLCGAVGGVVVGRRTPLVATRTTKKVIPVVPISAQAFMCMPMRSGTRQQSLPAVLGTYAVVWVAPFSPVDSAHLRSFIARLENRELPGTGARPTMDRRTRIS